MTGNIGAALKRKFGPLPAWAWLAILGGAVFLYRRSKTGAGPLGAANVPAAVTPGIDDSSAGLAQGTVLQPGEGYYDPNSGRLTINPQPPDVAPPPESAGDTSVGETLPPPVDGGTPSPAGAPAATRPGGAVKRALTGAALRSRQPKAKAGSAARKGARHPLRAAGKRGRAAATHRPGSGTRSRTAPHPDAHPKSSKPRPSAAGGGTPKRSRAAMPPRVALRQRPAAPRITHPAQQKVIKHPAHVRPHH